MVFTKGRETDVLIFGKMTPKPCVILQTLLCKPCREGRKENQVADFCPGAQVKQKRRRKMIKKEMLSSGPLPLQSSTKPL
jgi:hypothetical protein